MDAILLVALAVLALVVFDIAAWLWGVDSTEGFESTEWRKRQAWRGFSRY